jgi:hypothetical protein
MRKHWQDWGNLVLGLWVFVSPWVLQHTRPGPTRMAPSPSEPRPGPARRHPLPASQDNPVVAGAARFAKTADRSERQELDRFWNENTKH